MKARIIFMLLITLVLSAQNSVKAEGKIGFTAGLKGGVQFSQLSGHSWDDSYRVNLHGGFFMGLKGRRLGIQPEVIFNQSTYRTGSTFYDFYSGYYIDVKDSLHQGSFRLNTVTVPVLFQFRPFLNVWIQAGPEYRMVLSVKDKDKLLTQAEDMFNRGAVNGVVGLWLQHGKHFNTGARYSFGITDLNNSSVNQIWSARTIQIHLGINF